MITMDLDEIRRILDMVREHQLAEFELEQNGLRIRVRKEHGAPVATLPGDGAVSPAAPAEPALPPAPDRRGALPPTAPTSADETAEGLELAVVKSPIVGTFYRAAEPGAAPFIDVGQRVKKGQVLCIIEAMKLMNEIDSEYDGELVKVFVENGQPVQYGERLFAIRTS